MNMSCSMAFENNFDKHRIPIVINDNNLLNNNPRTIILNSRAYCHMFNSNALITYYKQVDRNRFNITGFKGNSEVAIGIGNIGILLDVLHVPNILKSII